MANVSAESHVLGDAKVDIVSAISSIRFGTPSHGANPSSNSNFHTPESAIETSLSSLVDPLDFLSVSSVSDAEDIAVGNVNADACSASILSGT